MAAFHGVWESSHTCCGHLVNSDVTEFHLTQVKKTTDISTERLVHVDKRPRTASPHFTVSKITVPKTEHGYEVRYGA